MGATRFSAAGISQGALRLIPVILLAAGAVYVLGLLRVLVIPAIIALFVTALLLPAYRWLAHRRVPPGLAAFLVLLVASAALIGFVAFTAPLVADRFDELGQEIAKALDDLDEVLAGSPFFGENFRLEQYYEELGSAISRAFQQSQGLAGSVFGIVRSTVEILTMTVLVVVVTFFYLKDGPRLGRFARDLFPKRYRDEVQLLGGKSWRVVSQYIAGTVKVALVDAVLIGLGLALLGVPLAVPLAVIVFFGAFFPIVGAFVTGLLAVLVAFAAGGTGLALLTLGLLVAVQQLEGNVVSPKVLGSTVSLHPLAIIAALTAGGLLLGIFGAFIAVPLAAVATRVTRHFAGKSPAYAGPSHSKN